MFGTNRVILHRGWNILAPSLVIRGQEVLGRKPELSLTQGRFSPTVQAEVSSCLQETA